MQCNCQIDDLFLPRDAMHSADYAFARYLCLLRSGVVTKRLNLSQSF